jgi:hypothetical protein
VEALDNQTQALKIREKSGDSSSIAQSYYIISDIYKQSDNYEKALEFGRKSLDIRQKRNSKIEISESLHAVGAIHFNFYHNDSALVYFRRALELNRELGYRVLEVHLLHALGNIFQDEGRLDSSIFYYKQSIKVSEELKSGLQVAKTTLNMARAYFTGRKYSKARSLLVPLEDTFKKYEQAVNLEDLYYHIAMCDSALGNHESAMKYAWLNRDIALENLSKRTSGQLQELQVKFELRENEEENKRLLLRTEIQELELHRSRLVQLILAVLFVLLAVIFILLWQRHKFKTAGEAIRLEQRLLRSQMNPHFIFNSLQAIQNFISTHNDKQTLVYLDSFASLTRDVLESSRTEVISLQKELTLLKNYLQLQQLRFGDRFEYHIHIAPGLQPNSIFLPPMLSQPFIENAIEHGLSEIESGGRVDIHFAVKDEILFMDIIDNGSGFQQNGKSQTEHNSLAIEITRERIELLNKKNKRKSSFTIQKAYPENPERPGVKVCFRIVMPVSL